MGLYENCSVHFGLPLLWLYNWQKIPQGFIICQAIVFVVAFEFLFPVFTDVLVGIWETQRQALLYSHHLLSVSYVVNFLSLHPFILSL